MPWCLVRRDSVKTGKSQPCPVSYETITAWLFCSAFGRTWNTVKATLNMLLLPLLLTLRNTQSQKNR